MEPTEILSSEEIKKIEQELDETEKSIEELRKKVISLNSRLAEKEIDDYVLKNFDGADVLLSSLFKDKKDLIVIHNMGRKCSYCSMWADGFNGIYKHIEKKAAFVLVSPDPPEVQKEFAEERGWTFNMLSSDGSTFIEDMGYKPKGYYPGASVFHKDNDGKIRRVSKTFFGPGDFYCSIWHFFDMLPQENNN